MPLFKSTPTNNNNPAAPSSETPPATSGPAAAAVDEKAPPSYGTERGTAGADGADAPCCGADDANPWGMKPQAGGNTGAKTGATITTNTNTNTKPSNRHSDAKEKEAEDDDNDGNDTDAPGGEAVGRGARRRRPAAAGSQADEPAGPARDTPANTPASGTTASTAAGAAAAAPGCSFSSSSQAPPQQQQQGGVSELESKIANALRADGGDLANLAGAGRQEAKDDGFVSMIRAVGAELGRDSKGEGGVDGVVEAEKNKIVKDVEKGGCGLAEGVANVGKGE
jgi:hypothetical protein